MMIKSNKKYLLLGGGWVASLLKSYLGNKAIIWNHEYYKIEQLTDISLNIDAVINLAARTNIDWCENHKLETFKSNVEGALNIAKICKFKGLKHVFFSSACIFESENKNDWKDEDSIPNPKCFYTETKVIAEKLIMEVNPDSLIIRPRLPISEIPHPRNTINKLLTYAQINDNQESVTVIEDMIPVLVDLINKDAKGIYHLVNEGTISPAEIASYFNHEFEVVSKESQNKRLAQEGRVKRVTTFVKSKKIPGLPNIRQRIIQLAQKYKEYAEN